MEIETRNRLIRYENILYGRSIKLLNHLTGSLITKDTKYINKCKKLISLIDEKNKEVELELNKLFKELIK